MSDQRGDTMSANSYLVAIIVDIMYVKAIRKQQELGQIIEDDTNTVIVEAIPKAVFVTIIHPLAHPHNRLGFGILCFVLQRRISTTRS